MTSRSNRPGSMSTHTLWCFRLKSSGRAGYGIRWNHIIFMGPDWSGRHGLSTTKSCADHVRPATDRREENRRADEPGQHRVRPTVPRRLPGSPKSPMSVSQEDRPMTSAPPNVQPPADHDGLDHDRGMAYDLTTLLNRRRMLQLIGGAGVLALAGCASSATGASDTTAAASERSSGSSGSSESSAGS